MFSQCAPQVKIALHANVLRTLGRLFEPHKCLWTCLQVYGLKIFSCHAGHQEVSRCCTKGESEESIACRLKRMQVRNPLGLETQGGHHWKSKTGISVAPQKRIYVLQFFLNMKEVRLIFWTKVHMRGYCVKVTF